MKNLDIIKEQVKKVITYSQNIEEPKVDWLINSWFKAKADFITMFGGLIYEGPQLTFKLSESDRLKEFFEFCEENQGISLPKSLTGRAISYALNQRATLEAFLEKPKIELTNNSAERAIKPFVIGRKNWLFCNTPDGARASAII